MERLKHSTSEVQERLLSLVQGEPLGPEIELTPTRLTALRAVFQATLFPNDWEAIAQAAASQIQQHVLDLMAS